MVTKYLVTNRKETENSVRFDLLADGKPLMQCVTFMNAFTYLLENVGAWDFYSYQESNDGSDEDKAQLTGAQLTHTHAQRKMQIMAMTQDTCKRCTGPTTWIGYCDIQPYGAYGLQNTFYMQCNVCGLYRQVGFANKDDWTGESYRHLMQNRIPFVRTARDPFIRNGTLRITSRSDFNPMGRVNLDGYEFETGNRIILYDQDAEEWREGRIEYAPEEDDNGHWYFLPNDDGSDLVLKQGMLAKRPTL